MYVINRGLFVAAVCLLIVGTPAWSADLTSSLEEGTVELQLAGPLAFGPQGILFVGDAKAATIYAIATGDSSGNPDEVKLNVNGIDQKVAAALGTTPDELLINDLAVNPLSGNAYLSVSRGRGPEAAQVLLKVNSDGAISELSLKKVKFAKATLPNAPEDKVTGEGRRASNQRLESITDLTFADGRLLVAGLSNEEFASTLRVLSFPFKTSDKGTAVEIYHGAHGGFETRSPVRTFATYNVQDEAQLLAAYTCTPLVKFPLSDLEPNKKIRGTTIAELGNRNRPLDMFVYNKDGKDFILMANSARGVMKISTEGIEANKGITERISGTAGQKYETIESLQGVVQLDRLNTNNALVLVEAGDKSLSLQTVALP